MPASFGAILVFTLATAFSTHLPPYRFGSPSRNSNASWMPVEAPEGTSAFPCAPPSNVTCTAIVGLPRESSTSRAWTEEMAPSDIAGFRRCPPPLRKRDGERRRFNRIALPYDPLAFVALVGEVPGVDADDGDIVDQRECDFAHRAVSTRYVDHCFPA